MFTLRFDMRAPGWAGSAADLYAAAIDMCEWAETRGAALAVLSEHHGTDDGHLPAPLMLASAIAARTRSLAILLAAVPIPLWDPVRLAEEMSVLDLIAGDASPTRSAWAIEVRNTSSSASTWPRGAGWRTRSWRCWARWCVASPWNIGGGRSALRRRADLPVDR